MGTNLQILPSLKLNGNIRHSLDSLVETVDHLVHGTAAFAKRLQVDQDAADVCRGLSLCIEIDILDVRIAAYSVRQLAHAQYHRRMGDIGCSFGGAVDQSVVLLGEEAFRNRKVE